MAFPERIIQFGEGNFLRAFADWMVDALNDRHLLCSSIVVVPPTRRGNPEPLNEQEGLYTVLLRGMNDGTQIEERRIVTAVSRAVSAYNSWDELVRTFCRPEIRLVVSNTTEAGIAFASEPFRPDECPDSFPAKITALLHHRFLACGADRAAGLIFLPCELIERNGATLREMVLRHAGNWSLGPAFASWVTEANHFLNTLVDRIVPGFPHDEAPQLTLELGYNDVLLTAAEWYHLWVIEGPPHLAAELPFERAGLNVIWTNDLKPFRDRKVRVLNGAHTTGALAAFLGGLNTVGDLMRDAIFGDFLRRALFEEIIPFAPGDAAERDAYTRAVLDRFQNPFLRHELLSIALNSVSKWRLRVLPSLLDYASVRGEPPPLLCFSLAALLLFYRGQRSATGEMIGWRGGETYPIRDEPSALDWFAEAWLEFEQHREPRRLAAGCLSNTMFWGRDLGTIPGMVERVAAPFSTMLNKGVRTALTRLLS